MMQRALLFAVALFAVLSWGTSAQAQEQHQQPNQISSEQQHQFNDAMTMGNAVVQTTVDCTRVAATRMQLAAEAKALEGVDGALGVLGAALAASKATIEVVDHQYTAAAQTVGSTAIDMAVCRTGPAKCAAWTAGRTIGNVINMLPAGSQYGQAVTVEDRVAQWYADWMSKPFNEQNYAKMNAEYLAMQKRNSEVERVSLASRACLVSPNDQAIVDRNKAKEAQLNGALGNLLADGKECLQYGGPDSDGYKRCMALREMVLKGSDPQAEERSAQVQEYYANKAVADRAAYTETQKQNAAELSGAFGSGFASGAASALENSAASQQGLYGVQGGTHPAASTPQPSGSRDMFAMGNATGCQRAAEPYVLQSLVGARTFKLTIRHRTTSRELRTEYARNQTSCDDRSWCKLNYACVGVPFGGVA